MPAPLLAGAGLVSWFYRIGTILITLLCIAGPFILGFLVFNEVLTFVGGILVDILGRTLPPGLTTSFATMGGQLDLSIVNAIIPLAEVILIVHWTLSIYLSVVIARGTMTFVSPMAKLASHGRNYLSWCASVSLLGKK